MLLELFACLDTNFFVRESWKTIRERNLGMTNREWRLNKMTGSRDDGQVGPLSGQFKTPRFFGYMNYYP